MDNSTAHSTTSTSPVSASYVDAYMPPVGVPPAPVAAMPDPAGPDPIPYTPPATDSVPTVEALDPVISQTSLPIMPNDAKPPATPNSSPSSSNQSEELEDQNIFNMLGVTDGTPEQRETFLDELQQVIWEDFLEYDVKLLTTKEEQIELEKMISMAGVTELEKQEKIVVYLEKLVPDLEEIMLEKALELKEEMARERLKSMREFFAGKVEQLAKIDSAEQLMNEGKWKSSVTLLNSLS